MGLAAAIGEFIAPALSSIGIGGTLLGTSVATDIGGALLGAGLGAGEGAITGGDPLLGALTGGATGFLGPVAGGAIGEAVPGLAGTAANALGGALVGAGASGITGGNPLFGALEGAAGPLLSSVAPDLFGTSGATATTPDMGTTGTPATPMAGGGMAAVAPTTGTPISGAGVSAAGAAAPAGTGLDAASSGLLNMGDFGATDVSSTITPALGGAPSAATSTPFGTSADASIAAGGPPLALPGGGGIGGGAGGTSGVGGPPNIPLGNVGNYAATAASGQPFNVVGPTGTDLGTVTPEGGGGGGGLFGGGSSGGGIGGAISSLTHNPLALLAGGGLLYDLMSQPNLPSVSSSIAPISGTANQLTTQGSQLASYLQSGNLPPGAQQAINSAAAAAKAQIMSRYASMGGGAETSSAAQQELANVDTVAATQGVQIAQQLLQTGISESQLGSQLYTELLNATLQQDQATGGAIANFASAMVPRTVTTVPAA